jgi:hypothetical protein
MAISYPPIFINDYLMEKIQSDSRFSFSMPFFPVSPSDIEQLTNRFPQGMYAVYDRMFKMRRSPFPHIKEEQLLYYFYKMSGDPEMLIETTQLVQDLLDRGDESASELNAWIRSKLTDGVYVKNNGGTSIKEFLPVYFHDIKIFQLEETRDIVDFGTARTYAGNKIIIDYRYHTRGAVSSSTITAQNGLETELEPDTYNDTPL